MLSGWRRASIAAYVTPVCLIAPAALAQKGAAWIDPPVAAAPVERKHVPLSVTTPRPEAEPQIAGRQARVSAVPASDDAEREAALETSPNGGGAERHALQMPADRPLRLASMSESLTEKKHAARDFAFAYLDRWSVPNRVTLASAASFYGSNVQFHGRTRSLASLIAEKRRFAERWPDRSYRYRPETTQISCEADGTRCTVWSIFDYSARNPRQGRRSSGIGAHEIVVSFAGATPTIASEDSRVLGRGSRR